MKLRNKKTGEYGKFMMCHDDDRCPFYIETTGGIRIYYSNFEEMLEAGWEAYVVPKEPLIKDEKIRDAVRAWADANGIHNPKFTHEDMDIVFDTEEHRLTWIDTSIEFDMITGLENLKDGRCYTITELCGEEEE